MIGPWSDKNHDVQCAHNFKRTFTWDDYQNWSLHLVCNTHCLVFALMSPATSVFISMPSLNFYFPKCLLRKATVRFIALATWERRYLLQRRSNSDFSSCFQLGLRFTTMTPLSQMSVVISEFMPNSTKKNLHLPQSLGHPCGHEWRSRGSSLRTVSQSPPHPELC